MVNYKNFILLGVVFSLFLVPFVFAQTEDLGNPGLTPDSPFYFLDSGFDWIQSSEAVADEKAAEIVAMAQENKVEALEKARERYEKAMQRRNRVAHNDENKTEEVARQSGHHLEVLADVYANAPEQAKPGLENAMENSAKAMNRSLNNLSEMNPERGERVALEVLARVMKNASGQAKKGLQNAIDSVGKNGENAGENTAQGKEAQGAGGGEGNFELFISDAPADIEDFDYLKVTINKVRIFTMGENGSEGGFEEREVNETVELTELIGEKAISVLSTNLSEGDYSKIELHVGEVEAMAGNETAEVKVPSGKLQIVNAFTITNEDTIRFVFDINVVKKGHSNDYNLLPVISKSGVIGKDLQEDEVEEVEETGEDEEEDEEETNSTVSGNETNSTVGNETNTTA